MSFWPKTYPVPSYQCRESELSDAWVLEVQRTMGADPSALTATAESELHGRRPPDNERTQRAMSMSGLQRLWCQIYDVTGGQKTVASNLAVDYEEMARSIGYPSVGTYQASQEWKAAAAQALQATGPRFIWLRVEPALPADMGTVQEPIADQMARVGALLDDD